MYIYKYIKTLTYEYMKVIIMIHQPSDTRVCMAVFNVNLHCSSHTHSIITYWTYLASPTIIT